MELKKKMIFIDIAVAVLGIVLGCFLQPQGSEYADYIRLTVQGKTTLFAAITANTVFVASVFLLGYFTFGFVLIYPLLFFKAYTAGVMASLCISIYGAYGIIYTAVYIFPVYAITLVLMTLLSSQSFTFSLSMLLAAKRRKF